MEIQFLKHEELEKIIGGGPCGQMTAIAMVSCGVAAIWPIGTLIAGPTCIGMGIGIIAEC
jgi:hypothetical protein